MPPMRHRPAALTPLLEIRHLRIVAAIDRAGTVSGAGRLVHMTQSAVSHALLDLERRLGVPLFERTQRGMVATHAGREVIVLADQVLEEMARLEIAIRGGPPPLARLRLAVQGYTAYHWLPAVLAATGDELTDRVELVPQAGRSPYRRLLADAIDLALVQGNGAPPSVVLLPLFEDPRVLVVPPGHHLAGADGITPEALGSERLMEHADTEFLRETGLWPADSVANGGVRPLLTETALQLVAAGTGITMMSRWAALPAVRNGSVVPVPIDHPAATVRWSAACRSGQRQDPLVQRFVVALREVARES